MLYLFKKSTVNEANINCYGQSHAFIFYQVNIPDEQATFSKGISLKRVYLIAVFSMLLFFTVIVLLPSGMHRQNYNEAQVGLLLAFISLVAVVAAHFMSKLSKLLGVILFVKSNIFKERINEMY